MNWSYSSIRQEILRLRTFRTQQSADQSPPSLSAVAFNAKSQPESCTDILVFGYGTQAHFEKTFGLLKYDTDRMQQPNHVR
jgi:hypothetical protein